MLRWEPFDGRAEDEIADPGGFTVRDAVKELPP